MSWRDRQQRLQAMRRQRTRGYDRSKGGAVEFDEEDFLFEPDSKMIAKKVALRLQGYRQLTCITGKVFIDGMLRTKRIEIMGKGESRQAHHAFLYEVMIEQDMSNPTTAAYHMMHPVLNKAVFKGAPEADYLVLTWEELMKGAFVAKGGEWVEYEQDT